MTDIDEYAEESGAELLLLEPREDFDPCIVGVVERFNQTFVLYDKAKVIEVHLKTGMDYSDVLEHYDFNMNGGWYGDGTWGFLVRFDE